MGLRMCRDIGLSVSNYYYYYYYKCPVCVCVCVCVARYLESNHIITKLAQ